MNHVIYVKLCDFFCLDSISQCVTALDPFWRRFLRHTLAGFLTCVNASSSPVYLQYISNGCVETNSTGSTNL